MWKIDSDIKTELVSFCENYYGNGSISRIFQMNEQIEPKDPGSVKWDVLRKRFSDAQSVVREALHITSNDIYIKRLERLLGELEHMEIFIPSALAVKVTKSGA